MWGELSDDCGWDKWADLLWVRRILGSSWWFRDMCWHLETSWGTLSWMTLSEDELRDIWIEIRQVVDELCWIRDILDKLAATSEHLKWWSGNWETSGVNCGELSWMGLYSNCDEFEALVTSLDEENGLEMGTRCNLGFKVASRLLIA